MVAPWEELAERINEGAAAEPGKLRRPPTASPSNRASEIGHECERYLVLSRTHGHLARPVSDTLLLIFDEGERHEHNAMERLFKMGIHVYGAQQAFPPNAYNITGHTDARHGTDENDDLLIVEIKGVNPNWFNYIRRHGIDGLRNHPKMVVRRWYAQNQTYAFLADAVGVVFVFKNKTTSELHAVGAGVDLEVCEFNTDKIDRVNAHVEAGTLPDPIKSPQTCLGCKFYLSPCQPAQDWGEGALILDDPELEGMVATKVEADPQRKIAEAMKKNIREAVIVACGGPDEFKAKDRSIICGDYLITTKVASDGKVRIDLKALGVEHETQEDEE